MFFGKKSVWAMDLNVAYVHYAKYGQLENFSDRSDECASTPFLLIYKSRLRGGLICGTPHIHEIFRIFCIVEDLYLVSSKELQGIFERYLNKNLLIMNLLKFSNIIQKNTSEFQGKV